MVNQIIALFLLGCFRFIRDRCNPFFQQTKPDASYLNATLPSMCLPPGWHRNYAEEFPQDTTNSHFYDPYYEALKHQHDDFNRFCGTIRFVGLVWSLSSAVALLNLVMLALTKHPSSETDRRRCPRMLFCFHCCSPALGLRLRVLSCLTLSVWSTATLFLHLIDIWVHGQLWWILVIAFFIAAEVWQIIIYDAYRRHIIMSKESRNDEQALDVSLDAPLLGPNASLPQNEGTHV